MALAKFKFQRGHAGAAPASALRTRYLAVALAAVDGAFTESGRDESEPHLVHLPATHSIVDFFLLTTHSLIWPSLHRAQVEPVKTSIAESNAAAVLFMAFSKGLASGSAWQSAPSAQHGYPSLFRRGRQRFHQIGNSLGSKSNAAPRSWREPEARADVRIVALPLKMSAELLLTGHAPPAKPTALMSTRNIMETTPVALRNFRSGRPAVRTVGDSVCASQIGKCERLRRGRQKKGRRSLMGRWPAVARAIRAAERRH